MESKKYEFRLNNLIQTWEEVTFEVNANSEKEAIEKAKNYSKEGDWYNEEKGFLCREILEDEKKYLNLNDVNYDTTSFILDSNGKKVYDNYMDEYKWLNKYFEKVRNVYELKAFYILLLFSFLLFIGISIKHLIK